MKRNVKPKRKAHQDEACAQEESTPKTRKACGEVNVTCTFKKQYNNCFYQIQKSDKTALVQITLKQIANPIAAWATSEVLMVNAAKGVNKGELKVLKAKMIEAYVDTREQGGSNTLEDFCRMFNNLSS